MKSFPFIITLFIVVCPLSAQNLLQEALILKPLFKESANGMLVANPDTQSAEATAVIRRYLPPGVRLNNFNLRTAFEENPFFDMSSAPQNAWDLSDSRAPGKANAGTAPQGFSVANLADGLARFLVNRTKQELSQAFFDEFKEKIKSNAYLGHFCPYTQNQLERIDTDVYQFKEYLQSLREGFTADMTALPGSTESFLRSEDLCKGCSDGEAGKVTIDLLHIGQQMVNGEPPIDMIAYLAQPGSAIQSAQPAAMPQLYNMASGLQFLNIISESFRNTASTDSQMPWFTAKEIREAFKDKDVLRIYLGLLWQRAKNLQFVDDSGAVNATMGNLMKQADAGAGLVENWRNSIQSLSELTQAMQYSLKSSGADERTVADDFFAYSQSVSDLLQAINQTGRVMLQRKKDLIPTEYIFLMRQCNSLYFNVRQRNFSGAVGNVIYCLNLLKGKTEADKKAISTLLRYANFMAAVAEANSADEMESAIEAFALPPGSSRMKKTAGRFTLAINAYTGFAWGREYLDGENGGKKIAALSAPLGLSGSFGLGKAGSLGFFVPVIDVGALTAYRFKDDSAQNLPELTWGNILSPGFYVVYDTPGKWPFAIGYGAQIGPGLRKVSEMGLNVEKSGWRQGLFLSVDIPITYLYLGK
jgi:hypothetical protein